MPSPDEPAPSERRSALERLLSVFTQVKAGEGISAVLLTLNVFLLLTAYYVIKPLRDSMIGVMEAGPQYKSYLSAVIAVALLGAVPAYARYAKRLPRNRLVVGVTLFFVSNLALFALAMSSHTLRAARIPLGPLGAILPTSSVELMPVVFFVWVGLFNMMVVAQFWAFANDVYTEEQGQRLFAMVGIGASSGAALGAGVVKTMARQLDTAELFAVSAILLSLCALLTQVVHVRETRRPEGGRQKAIKDQNAGDIGAATEAGKKSGEGAFQMVWRHRYLTYLAAFSVVFTLVNTNGEYMRDEAMNQWVMGAVDDHGPFESGEALHDFKEEMGNAFTGDFYFYVNLLGALLQMFVVSRLVRYAGLGPTFFVLPVIAVMGATAIALAPVLAVVRISKIAENATDYSINNTTRNMLWLPTTTEMKYQAKQAVDTFFVRMGDVGSAVTVAVLAGVLGLGIRAFAVANLFLLVGWLFLAAAILRERKVLRDSQEHDERKEAAAT
ncbi:MAG: MFS transporter [Acidobacteria bacterium]|nr:MFS transporter [Acidobacteriota bacterium]